MAARRLKHWGWGYEDQQPPYEQVRDTALGLRAHLGFGEAEVERPVPLEDVELRAPRLTVPEPLDEITAVDPYSRASHALGKAYRDVVRGFRGQFDDPPDAVIRPRDEQELERALDWACSDDVAVIPYGGGTSVVGGVEPRGLERAVSLDVRLLDRVLEIDRASRAARIQAGATGPGLEDQLREHDLTLRHFPQSFEYSTLGGWIATRAGGHFATLMTHIDDLVESVRALTPGGWWESRRLPGSGAGPSPDRMLIGSEGTLGVITEAWMRVQDRPRWKASAGVLFDTFAAGGEAVRALGQSGLWPSNCRLLDEAEGALTMAAPDGKALLVLGFESADHPVDAWLERALELARDHGGETARVEGNRRRWRRLGRRVAKRVRAGAIPARLVRSRRRDHGYLRDRDHLGSVGGVRRGGARARRTRGHRDLWRWARELPLHARVPGRAGALLHRPRSRAARRRDRAVGRDQVSGIGRRHRCGRDRSPTTTPSAATTGRGTTVSGRIRSPPR